MLEAKAALEKLGQPRRASSGLSVAVENCLSSAYYVDSRGSPVTGARLAQKLRVSRPTVSGLLRRMVRDGLVTLDSKKRVMLTERGRKLAESVVRRHRLAERLFSDVLGMGWYESHEGAHRFEHAISPEMEERLSAFLGHPITCPHGNPIPGNHPLPIPKTVMLSEAQTGYSGVVDSITEDLEEDAWAMEYLHRHYVRPGRPFKVLEVSPFNDTVTLQTDGGVVAVGLRLAGEVRVREK